MVSGPPKFKNSTPNLTSFLKVFSVKFPLFSACLFNMSSLKLVANFMLALLAPLLYRAAVIKNGRNAVAEAIMTATMEMKRREYEGNNEVTRFLAILMV